MYVVRCCTPQIRPHTVVWVSMTRCLRHPAKAHKSPCAAQQDTIAQRKRKITTSRTHARIGTCVPTPQQHGCGCNLAATQNLIQRGLWSPWAKTGSTPKDDSFPDSGKNCSAYQSCPTMSGSFTKQLSACRNA